MRKILLALILPLCFGGSIWGQELERGSRHAVELGFGKTLNTSGLTYNLVLGYNFDYRVRKGWVVLGTETTSFYDIDHKLSEHAVLFTDIHLGYKIPVNSLFDIAFLAGFTIESYGDLPSLESPNNPDPYGGAFNTNGWFIYSNNISCYWFPNFTIAAYHHLGNHWLIKYSISHYALLYYKHEYSAYLKEYDSFFNDVIHRFNKSAYVKLGVGIQYQF